MPLVTCAAIEDVRWVDSTIDTFALNDTVHIWRVSISAGLKHSNAHEYVLNDTELDRAAKYHHKKDNDRFLLSRILLRVLLGRYLGSAPETIQLLVGANKKPYVDSLTAQKIQYNVTHSGDYILIAIAETSIGIDVEQIKQDFNYSDLLPECFAQNEIIATESSLDPHQTFYELWTRKEALLKATGKGIDQDMKLVPSLSGGHNCTAGVIGSVADWMTVSFEVIKGYQASVSFENTVSTLNFLEGHEVLM